MRNRSKAMNSELQVSNALLELKPVLLQWRETHNQYSEALDWKDAAWLYGERANIGILATAVWRSGGIAIEEFHAKKNHDEKGEYAGRSDLWFYFKSTGTAYHVEAKQISIRLPASKEQQTQLDRAQGQLVQAENDARKIAIKAEKGIKNSRSAVLFVRFDLKANAESADNALETITNLTKALGEPGDSKRESGFVLVGDAGSDTNQRWNKKGETRRIACAMVISLVHPTDESKRSKS